MKDAETPTQSVIWPSTDIKVIETGVLDTLTTVHLYDETIVKVATKHPEVPAELPCMVTAVETAISSPTHVEASHSNSFVFVDAGTTNKSGDPLRVPVKVVDGTSGRVKSFYFATPEGEREIIWRRNDA